MKKALMGLAVALAVSCPPAFASEANPEVICEVAAVKSPTNTNAVSAVYIAYGDLSAKEVRILCLGDQSGGGPDDEDDK